MDAVSDELRVIMRARRHLAPGAPDTFTIDTSATFQNMLGKILNNFGAVVAAIAAISLVVGGIVIMNIMLVSVTERTREIGVRKALGARRKDILLQFLIESATMSLVGGVIGVIRRHRRGQADYADHLRFPPSVAALVDSGRPVRGHGRRPVLRRLSGAQGRATRSHRRPESGAISMRLSDSKESVRLALDTLRKNKLRSGLTILGISIGISTVILISSAINGLNTNIDQFVNSLGTNDLWVFHFEPFGKRPTTEELNRKKLTYEDGMAMRSLPHVVAVDPESDLSEFSTRPRQCLASSTAPQDSEHHPQRRHSSGERDQRHRASRRPHVDRRRRRAHAPMWLSWATTPPKISFPASIPSARTSNAEAASLPSSACSISSRSPSAAAAIPQDNAAYFPLDTFHNSIPS